MPSEITNASGRTGFLRTSGRKVRFGMSRPAKRGSYTSQPWLPLATLILTACSNPAAEAEKRYHMVQRNGTKNELCAAGRDLASEYLKAGDEKKYKEWHLYSSIDCRLAEQTYGDGPALETEAYKAAQAEASAAARQAQEDAYKAVYGPDVVAEASAAAKKADDDAKALVEAENASEQAQ